MKHSDKFEFYAGINPEARFKIANSWVCFDSTGRIYIVEYGIVKKDMCSSIGYAMEWIKTFGDRD